MPHTFNQSFPWMLIANRSSSRRFQVDDEGCAVPYGAMLPLPSTIAGVWLNEIDGWLDGEAGGCQHHQLGTCHSHSGEGNPHERTQKNKKGNLLGGFWFNLRKMAGTSRGTLAPTRNTGGRAKWKLA